MPFTQAKLRDIVRAAAIPEAEKGRLHAFVNGFFPAATNGLQPSEVVAALQGHLSLTGSSETKEMLKFIFEDVKARQSREQTIKVAISAATEEKQKLVEDATGVRFFPVAVPRSDARKRQRIEQEFADAAPWYKRYTAAGGQSEQSIRRFVWTGAEDSAEEVERMMLRIQALIGWDEFPSELVQHDVHAALLFNVRIEDSTPWITITGTSDMSLQHAEVDVGAFMLEDTLMLFALKVDLSTAASMEEAGAQAYMQYVAFYLSTGRFVPVLLTDGNIHVLYIYNPRVGMHQQLYWSFDRIVDAAMYLEALVKKLAASNPVQHGYDPSVPDDPLPQDNNTGMRDPPPVHDEDMPEQPSSEAGPYAQHSPSSSDSHSHQQSVQSEEWRDAELKEALRLAMFHPVATTLLGLPPYPKPRKYDL